ncbi:MAG: DUF308 domain-containing protein [Lachnospiraceae bacterium]|nr:DUF308 domain-containing protein [Lachnospiraceae bacterium]MDY5699741.1 DUF308 domain-containing protein [Lachnospiraceae bacterium]
MKSLRQNANNIFLCVFEVLIGILVLIDPVAFSSGIIIAAGILMILSGAVCVFRYFWMKPEEAMLSQQLLKGLLFLLAGIICTWKYQWVLSTFPLLTVIYGVGILIAGLAKIQWAVDLLRLKRQRWFLPAISAVVSLLCAAIILSNPFYAIEVLWVFIGVSLILESIFDIISLLLGGRSKEETDKDGGYKTDEGQKDDGGNSEENTSASLIEQS